MGLESTVSSIIETFRMVNDPPPFTKEDWQNIRFMLRATKKAEMCVPPAQIQSDLMQVSKSEGVWLAWIEESLQKYIQTATGEAKSFYEVTDGCYRATRAWLQSLKPVPEILIPYGERERGRQAR